MTTEFLYRVTHRAAPATMSVTIGHRLRKCAIKQYARLCPGELSVAIGGKDEYGRPLRGHPHAHWLSLDLDNDRYIDHILVYASGGLDDYDLAALSEIRKIGDMRIEESPNDIEWSPCGVWQSVTPYIPPRKWGDGRTDRETDRPDFAPRDFPEQTLIEEMERAGIPWDRIETVDGVGYEDGFVPWGIFRQRREGRGTHDDCAGTGFRIYTTRAVCGPMMFGYARHFGLGMFMPRHEE